MLTSPATVRAGPNGAIHSNDGLAFWKKQLITKEDFMHLHKLVGVIVLISIFIRFCMIGERDMGFKSHPQWTWPTLAFHFLLNLTSFQFKIPKARIRDGGRIWPEYRLHAAVFCYRSIAFIALYEWERVHHLEPNYFMNFVILMGGMTAADLCTLSADPKHRSRTIRDIDFHPTGKFFFSVMQFDASASFLYGLRICSLPFLVIIVVQLTPFLATLRRKQLFTSNVGGAAIYGSMLCVGGVNLHHAYMKEGVQTALLVRTIAGLAALQRMMYWPKRLDFLSNKYVVWTTMYVLLMHLRPIMHQIPVEKLTGALVETFLCVIVLGYFKTIEGLEKDKVKKEIKSL